MSSPIVGHHVQWAKHLQIFSGLLQLNLARKMVEPPFTGCLRTLLAIMRRYFTIREGIAIPCYAQLAHVESHCAFGAAFFGICMHFWIFRYLARNVVVYIEQHVARWKFSIEDGDSPLP